MKAVLVCSAGALAFADPPKPTLPQQWTAMQTGDVAINQGGIEVDGNLCCPHNAANCKVQAGHSADTFHFDFPNNRTRSGDIGEDHAIVSLYGSVGKELLVSANNTCLQYCPLQFDLGPFRLDDDATYVGRTVFQGKEADAWNWVEYIIPKLHLGKMQETNFFVSTDETPVPLQENDIIEPFGQRLGQENQTWSNFKAGPPPSAAFKVLKIDSCPMSPNCNDNKRVAHRKRARDLNNWAFYEFPQLFVQATQQATLMTMVV